MTERDLVLAHAWVPWWTPLKVVRMHEHGYVCRFCVAHKGLNQQTPLRSYGLVREHLRAEHLIG